MRNLAIALVTSATSSTYASFVSISGTLDAWDFADGNPVSSGGTVITAGGTTIDGVHTDGGLGDFETAVSMTFGAQPGGLFVDLVGKSGGNGVWSAVARFTLDDATGMGWVLTESSSSAFFGSQIVFEADDSLGNAGSIGNVEGQMIASAGDYLIRVLNPDWESTFAASRGGATDDTWTDASGSYRLDLIAVPAPASVVVLGVLFAPRRRR